MTDDATPPPTDGPPQVGAGDPDADRRIPTDATPVRCPYCAAPFARDEYVELHVGLEHGDRASEAEVAAFQAAYEGEREALRRFQLRALVALVVLYFGFLFAFSVFG
jgi:hypothetical protein